MTNCCDEISDPTPILVASRIAQDHDPIEAGSFVESDRIEKSWADEKLVIRSLFHSDRIVSGIGPWASVATMLSKHQCISSYSWVKCLSTKHPSFSTTSRKQNTNKNTFSSQALNASFQFDLRCTMCDNLVHLCLVKLLLCINGDMMYNFILKITIWKNLLIISCCVSIYFGDNWWL